jgi:hypothetical protein
MTKVAVLEVKISLNEGGPLLRPTISDNGGLHLSAMFAAGFAIST